MAYLFVIQDRLVQPNPETLLISPFKEIWNRDKSEGKEVALQEFAYIEFMTSFKKSNPYRQLPEREKEVKVRSSTVKLEKWEPDDLVLEGIKTIRMFQTEASTTFRYYESAKNAIEAMIDFFNTVDLSEKNYKSGNPLYQPQQITRAFNDLEKNIANLKALEKRVNEEILEESKKKGDKEISFFATVESLKGR